MEDDTEAIEAKMLISAKLLERMVSPVSWFTNIGTAQGFQVNLDTYDDVAKDYRFYEDPGDEFRNPPDGASQTNK